MQGLQRRSEGGRLSKTALVVSLSLIVFVFACLAMYVAWLVAASLGDFWRGLSALLVWIVTFGASTLVFWNIVQKISREGIRA